MYQSRGKSEKAGPAEVKVWLCPMCGSKLKVEQADQLKKGELVTCEYCGTSVE